MSKQISADQQGDLADVFEQERRRLVAVATRILGSSADAEDAVQETWLRLTRTDETTIDNVRGWLTTVVGRICLDQLRSRKARPVLDYQEVLVTIDDPLAAPDIEAELTDSVGVALQVVLETLSPAERLAFVLHDVFAVPFDDIGRILGTSTAGSKMAASRARRKVRGGTSASEASHARRRAVVDAFLVAARDGDFQRLLAVLDPDVVLRADTPGGVVVTLGATQVASRARYFASLAAHTRPVLVDGLPGTVSWTADGAPASLMVFFVIDGRITAISSLADPARLALVELPTSPAQG